MSVVLLYHRVAAPSADPFDLAVHPDHFAAHVEHLAELGATAPLQDLVDSRDARGIAVTFDDGYADNATSAAPLLADAGLPATWFITTATLGRRRFWWDRLSGALLGTHAVPDSIDVSVAGKDLWLDLRTSSARRTALTFLHRRLLPLPPEQIEATVAHILEALGSPGSEEDGCTMSIEQLRHLASLPLQEVGAHTRTHAHLATQSAHRQRDEIDGSVRELESLIQRPISSFAYPFGGPGTVGTLAPRLVADAGCQLACTTVTGRVGRRADRYHVPRLTVLDWDAEEFAMRVSAALGR
jgi:peptidoglycan/xylan/chitin deacetylase (PgdA/CDA1 family)